MQHDDNPPAPRRPAVSTARMLLAQAWARHAPPFLVPGLLITEKRLRRAFGPALSAQERRRVARAYCAYVALAHIDRPAHLRWSLLPSDASLDRASVLLLPGPFHDAAAHWLKDSFPVQAIVITPAPLHDPAGFDTAVDAALQSSPRGPLLIASARRIGLDTVTVFVRNAPLLAGDEPAWRERLARDIDDIVRDTPAQYDWAASPTTHSRESIA